MTANNLLMHCLADVLDVPVVRPIVAETPSLGAAYAADLPWASGWRWTTSGPTGTRRRQWLPGMEPAVREKGYRKWRKAVQRTLDWVDDDDDE